MIFHLIIYLFILTNTIIAYELSIITDGVVPNQGSFGVTISFEDTSPETDTDILIVDLIQGSNPRSASGNVTIIGGQSGEVVISLQYTNALPPGANGVYLLAKLYPISFIDNPDTAPLLVTGSSYLTVVADGLTDCIAGSIFTAGATSESLRITPGTFLSAPSCGSFRLPVTLGVLSNSYVLVTLVDSNNVIYGTGKCKVRTGLKGALSVPVTIVKDIPLNKDILTNLFLVNQSLYDSFPDTAIEENYASQIGVITDITKCPASSPASAKDKSINFLQQNGFYILGAALIVIIIAVIIFCLHKKARARGTSIIFMIRKSTVASRKSVRGARLSSVELEQMSASKKEIEAHMLHEPFSGFEDLQYPETQSPYSPAPSSPTPSPPQQVQASPPHHPEPPQPPEPSPPPIPQPPSPPPNQWEKVQDYEKGVEYYWNPATGATQWEKPDGF